jgi:hypothetical protein
MNHRLIFISLLLACMAVACEQSDLDMQLVNDCQDRADCEPSGDDDTETHLDETDTSEFQDTETHLDDTDTSEFQDTDHASDDGSFDDLLDDDQTDQTDDENSDEAGERGDGGDVPTDPMRIQAIGDSHLAFNDGMSTANQIRDVLIEQGADVIVQNNAVGGATLGCGENGIGSPDNCIPPQFQDGQWTHVVLSGGGNDFLESQCGVDVDALISPNLERGLMVDLVDRIRAGGPMVTIVGYVSPLDPQGEAGSCQPIRTLLDRYHAFASARQGVRFVNTMEVFGPDQRSMYADDVHTSVEGSRRLAEAIVDDMLR